VLDELPKRVNLVPLLPQELLLTRLAVGIVEREDDDVTMEKLDKALGELFEKKVLRGGLGLGGGAKCCSHFRSLLTMRHVDVDFCVVRHLAPGENSIACPVRPFEAFRAYRWCRPGLKLSENWTACVPFGISSARRGGTSFSRNSTLKKYPSAFQFAGSGPGALGGLPAACRAGPGRDRGLAGWPSYHEHAWFVSDVIASILGSSFSRSTLTRALSAKAPSSLCSPSAFADGNRAR